MALDLPNAICQGHKDQRNLLEDLQHSRRVKLQTCSSYIDRQPGNTGFSVISEAGYLEEGDLQLLGSLGKLGSHHAGTQGVVPMQPAAAVLLQVVLHEDLGVQGQLLGQRGFHDWVAGPVAGGQNIHIHLHSRRHLPLHHCLQTFGLQIGYASHHFKRPFAGNSFLDSTRVFSLVFAYMGYTPLINGRLLLPPSCPLCGRKHRKLRECQQSAIKRAYDGTTPGGPLRIA